MTVPATAKCAYYDETGPAREVLVQGQMQVRAPAPGEVLIRVFASGVNPTDVKSRGGAPGRAKEFDRIIPHFDGAGTVDAVGAGVPATLVGQNVWVFCARHERPFGTAAEYLSIDKSLVALLPKGVSFEVGACLGIPAMTAWNAVLGSGPVTGRTVLVTGGAGAVGHCAVQIARRQGAFVIATISSAAKGEEALSAGAHRVVNYRDPDAADQIMALTAGRGVDLMVDVDTTANARLATRVMALGGQISSYGSGSLDADIPVRDLRQRCVSIRFLTIFRFETAQLQTYAAGINAMLEAGTLQHRIAQRFPLSEIAAAHEAVESGALTGKVVVSISG